MLEPVFYHINTFYNVNGKVYVNGEVESDKNIKNIYDITNKGFVLPETIAKKVINIKPIDSDNWIIEMDTDNKPANVSYSSDFAKTGVYSVSQNKFVIAPNKSYKFSNGQIKTNFKGFVVINLLNGESKLFNLKTGKIISANINAEYKSVVLKKEDKESSFILVALQPNRKSSDKFCTLYKPDGSIIFENIKMYSRDLHNKGDFFYIQEKLNCYPCQIAYTAFDLDGKIIAEKQKYNPTK